MSTVTEPLREEHRELLPHVDLLRSVAEQVGDVTVESLRKGVDGTYDFLSRHLIPHATAEDEALYPVVNRLLGAPGATVTMSRDHVEVGRLTDELGEIRERLNRGALGPEDEKALRRVLYGLYALVKVHFAKEEEIYLPLLDARLSPDDAGRMFQAMEAAAGRAKAARHA